MADWSLPSLTSSYSDFLTYLKSRDDDAAKMFDGTGTNVPTNTIRWSSANNRFEKYNGTTWSILTARLLMTSDSLYNSAISGSATISDASAAATNILWTSNKITTFANDYYTKTEIDTIRADYILKNGNTGTLTIGTNDASSFSLETNNTSRFSIGSTGNITANAPTSGNTLTVNNVAGGKSISATGDITGSTLTSTVATGTAPLVVASTTKVTNLNADLLDGLSADSADTTSTVVSRDTNGVSAFKGVQLTAGGDLELLSTGYTTAKIDNNNGVLRVFDSTDLLTLTTSTGDLGIKGNLTVPGTSTVTGNSTFGGTLSVTGLLTANGGISVPDSAFTIKDNVDNTKAAQFQLSGITTGTARIYTLPDVSATLAHLGNVGQTFTGSVVFSGASVSISGAVALIGTNTGVASYTIGSGATTSGNTKNISIGTSGLSGSTTNIDFGSAVSGATNAFTFAGTGAVALPSGTEAQRPTLSSTLRAIRYNNDISSWEGWNGITWVALTGASLDSPAFTGTPTAPTASVGTDTTQIATTAFVKASEKTQGVFVATYELADGTVGAAVSAGINTYVLNTVRKNTITGASLASSNITLPAGKYLVDGFFTVNSVGSSRINLRSSSTYYGTSVQSVDSTYAAKYPISMHDYFELPTSTNVYMELVNSAAGNLGTAASGITGSNEFYAMIKIVKVG